MEHHGSESMQTGLSSDVSRAAAARIVAAATACTTRWSAASGTTDLAARVVASATAAGSPDPGSDPGFEPGSES